MEELLYYFAVGVVSAVTAMFVVSLLSKYWQKALEQFKKAWRTFERARRAAGVLIRRGKRLFKLYVTQLLNGELESYEDEEDEGVEIKYDELTPEAKRALSEDDFIVIEKYA